MWNRTSLLQGRLPAAYAITRKPFSSQPPYRVHRFCVGNWQTQHSYTLLMCKCASVTSLAGAAVAVVLSQVVVAAEVAVEELHVDSQEKVLVICRYLDKMHPVDLEVPGSSYCL